MNKRYTKLSLTKSGNLVLTDAGQITVWTSNSVSDSNSPAQLYLQLHDNGNLILQKSNDDKIIWQSFDYPTDTLLPHQLLTETASLVSSRSSTNHSSGFYKLFFDNDNVLRLMYKGPEITSVFWPDPWLNSWGGGRSTYNNSKVAMFDSSGRFFSSDELKFSTSDYSGGSGIPIQRRLTLDVDGNLRIHSLNIASKTWEVSWQAVGNPCKIHGICGENSLCTYSPYTGRKCTCLPGYKLKNLTDWTDGCVPGFQHSCSGGSTSVFLQLPNVEFYGFDVGFFQNYTLKRCESLCLQYCDCKGFQYKFDPESGSYNCYPKTIMFNGYSSIGFSHPIYVRLPKDSSISLENNPLVQDFRLQCSGGSVIPLEVGSYGRKHQHGSLKSFFWSTCAVGVFEITCLLAYLIRTRMQSNSSAVQGYHLQVAAGFRKFTYSELKKATANFSKEIGRGGGGIVYKGVLTDNRVAAIKCLKEANQGEAEFLAEVSIIGRLNHMNLIEIWGYCAEGKHRLLVYEYMEHGSLRKNFQGQESGNLDWKKRYEIALGTARGLAYLHEECLEWVLHCDVKPENILLSDNYQPKVADFGLSKLLIRDGGISSKQDFSRIRGTRGYMAPEWVFNLPITSKVDVYSYGLVVLEMVTGRSPSGGQVNNNNNSGGGGGGSRHSSGGMEPRGLVNWVRENWRNHTGGSDTKLSQIQYLLDPAMNVNEECDVEKMATLIEVALQCSEEDKDSRPTMSQVVDMLQLQDIDK